MSNQPEEEVTDFTGVKNKDLTAKQRRNRKAARVGKYTDRNLDGIPDQDQVDWSKLQADLRWVEQLITEVDEIKALFDKAVTDGAFLSQTGINGFVADVMNSQWWQDNDEFARRAFEQRTTDPATYAQSLEDAREAVRVEAAAMGAMPDEATINALAERFVIEGWSDPARAFRLRNALMTKIQRDTTGMFRGTAGRTEDRLRQTAARNGLEFDANFYNSAVQSVASGLTDDEYWERTIREQAASYWPSYSEQIRAGLDAMSLASGYMNVMARTLEIDPNSISLNDPYIRKATTMVDESGNPRPMSLWEFQQDLRNDPRWMNTDQAVKSVSDIATGILERFGIL